MRRQLFVYGSCVSRDILRIVSGRFGLVHYAARQSWISAVSQPMERPRSIELSPFSARSLRGDFASNVPYLLRKKGTQADVILIDIASDRHGVYPVGDSFLSNTGELRRSNLLRGISHGELIEFGTREHKMLFRDSAAKLKRIMERAGIFERALVLNVKFSGTSDDGSVVPLARGKTANEVNELYSFYYQTFSSLGFESTPVPPQELQVASAQHKWGLQQDHFVDPLYYWWADRIDEFAGKAP